MKQSSKPEEHVRQAIIEGIHDFSIHSRESVDMFVDSHFRYPGCWNTNRIAFGFDLIRAPINLFWAPFYVALQVLIALLGFVGLRQARALHVRIPSGLTTQVQQNINHLIKTQLLNTGELKQCITRRLEPITTSGAEENKHIQRRLESILDEALNQLMQTRTATADISNSIISTLFGALAFNKFTPGGIGIGIMLSMLYVQHHSAENFFLGSTLGSVYYTVFPAKAGLWETGVGVVLVMMIFSIIASFSGLLTDPLQSLLRLHHRRLNKMINQLESDIASNHHSRFKTLDPYVARILEVFDVIKSQIH